jgi:prolyl-tRNA editing enzyme YbaK/EbsC (Cys-tRNA(Pro) deacylase)
MSEYEKLSRSALRVQSALKQLDLSLHVLELPESTRTAKEAAAAIGCEVGQIVKSLIFRGQETGRAYLVLVSGKNRANIALLSDLCGESLDFADPDFVRAETGFSIGGVPPLGHRNPIPAIIDKDLFEYPEIWAAAGTPHAVFRLSPQELSTIAGENIQPIV